MYSLIFEVGRTSYYRYRDRWRINMYNYNQDETIYNAQQIQTIILNKITERIDSVHKYFPLAGIEIELLCLDMSLSRAWESKRCPCLSLISDSPPHDLISISSPHDLISIHLRSPMSLELELIRALIKGSAIVYTEEGTIELPPTKDYFEVNRRPISKIDDWYKEAIQSVMSERRRK